MVVIFPVLFVLKVSEYALGAGGTLLCEVFYMISTSEPESAGVRALVCITGVLAVAASVALHQRRENLRIARALQSRLALEAETQRAILERVIPKAFLPDLKMNRRVMNSASGVTVRGPLLYSRGAVRAEWPCRRPDSQARRARTRRCCSRR